MRMRWMKRFMSRRMKERPMRKGKHMAGKRIDEDVRQRVVEFHGNGVPRKKIAEELSISVSSVNRIIRERSAQESKKEEQSEIRDAEMQRKIADIERRIAELEKKILNFEARKKRRGFWF